MKVAIINYNAGNVRSVLFAMERLGIQASLTSNHNEIRTADKVIFPGVGEASTTMQFLKDQGLDEVIRSLRQPVLGICLGMQLLCEHSEEYDTPCLGVIPHQVVRFRPSNNEKVPHMGWNVLEELKTPLFDQVSTNNYVYFVHSYYVSKGPHTIATSPYIESFSAALRKDNFYATQFHPEKSGKVGEQILKNFLNL